MNKKEITIVSLIAIYVIFQAVFVYRMYFDESLICKLSQGKKIEQVATGNINTNNKTPSEKIQN